MPVFTDSSLRTSFVAKIPSSPVHAFALPLLTIIDCILFLLIIFLPTNTGAAKTLFFVNTA